MHIPNIQYLLFLRCLEQYRVRLWHPILLQLVEMVARTHAWPAAPAGTAFWTHCFKYDTI